MKTLKRSELKNHDAESLKAIASNRAYVSIHNKVCWQIKARARNVKECPAITLTNLWQMSADKINELLKQCGKIRIVDGKRSNGYYGTVETICYLVKVK